MDILQQNLHHALPPTISDIRYRRELEAKDVVGDLYTRFNRGEPASTRVVPQPIVNDRTNLTSSFNPQGQGT